MMFTLVRLIFAVIIVGVIFVIFNKKLRPMTRKKWIMLIVGVFVVFLINSALLLELSFLRFDTIEKAFQYRYSGDQILKVIDSNETSFIIYKDDDTYAYAYLKKYDNKWGYNTTITDYKHMNWQNYDISTLTNNETNEKLIVVDIIDFEENDSINDVQDSLSSQFIQYFPPPQNLDYNIVYYYTIIDSRTEDYKLIINNSIIDIEI